MAPLGVAQHPDHHPARGGEWSLRRSRLPLVPWIAPVYSSNSHREGGVILLLTPPGLMTFRNNFTYLLLLAALVHQRCWGFSLLAARRLLIAAAPVGLQCGL